jgi:hypothetical protein
MAKRGRRAQPSANRMSELPTIYVVSLEQLVFVCDASLRAVELAERCLQERYALGRVSGEVRGQRQRRWLGFLGRTVSRSRPIAAASSAPIVRR